MRATTIATMVAMASSAVAFPFFPSGNKPNNGGHHRGPPGRPHRGPPKNHGGAAAPGPVPTAPATNGQCLTKAEGEEAADVFRQLIQEYSDEVALEYLTEDFVDWSSSVLGIINGGGDKPKDLLAPAFNSRQEFIDGQGSQPEIPFEKIQVWVGCDFVTMRWKTSDSAAGQESKAAEIPVVGNVIITTVPAEESDPHAFRISEIFSEFSNAAWLVNLGVFVPDAADVDTDAKRDVKNLRGNMI